ncbi:PASTA domain-containing protein [Streptomyces sp. NPDC037389]|uniref:PASTA domain-containing protein n=1 Tax=Streptomyces sp. NPDC037389 TaxID=3155369 RepID=UPI0033E61CA1
MRKRTATITTLATAGLLAITGCSPNTDNGGGATTDSSPPATHRTPKADNTPKADGAGAKTASLPDMTGKGLQSAQDRAQAAGFHHLASHDALGRGRMQALDRNWKVCSQTPKPGEHPTATKVDFAAVKLEETCPAKDEGATPEAAGSTMPDFTGKSVKVARRALDSGTSLTVKDASRQDRMVLVESNWQVCSQQPTAGAKLDGQPVSLTAVKFGEPC